VRLLCDSRRFPVERRCRVSDQAARQERLAGFRAWAEADTGDRHEWLMTRGDAREWLAERDALAAQLDELLRMLDGAGMHALVQKCRAGLIGAREGPP
jgi:hypothetical protein